MSQWRNWVGEILEAFKAKGAPDEFMMYVNKLIASSPEQPRDLDSLYNVIMELAKGFFRQQGGSSGADPEMMKQL